MKSLKRAILVILVLNLLAMLGGVGWLLGTGRVNKARVVDLTRMFDEPVAIEQARMEAEEREEEAAKAARPRPLPEHALNSEERNLVRVEMTQVDMARLERMKREVEDLRASLRNERRSIAVEREALARERAEFESMRERLMAIEGDEQFEKALQTLKGLAPQDASALLTTLLNQENKYEQVISYLSALDTRSRTAIVSEFVQDGQQQLAADLLESLRLRGLETTPADGITP